MKPSSPSGTYGFTGNKSEEARQKRSLELSANAIDIFIDPTMERDPKFKVYLYTVSQVDYILHRPPYAKNLKVLPVEEKGQFRLITTLPDIYPAKDYDPMSNTILVKNIDGRKIAMDILFPGNTGLDQDLVLNPEIAEMNDINYVERGLFWSVTSPDKMTPAEVSKATKRMENYYRRLLKEAKSAQIRGPKTLEEYLLKNRDAFHADKYFNTRADWNTILEAPEQCENCGENKRSGTKFHRTADGIICVQPTVEGWKAAVNAGVKKYDDVPDDFQWKAAKPATKKSKPVAEAEAD